MGLFFFLLKRPPPRSTLTDALSPYTTLFRSPRNLVSARSHRVRLADLSARPAGEGPGGGGRGDDLPQGQAQHLCRRAQPRPEAVARDRSEEHTSELQSLMRISHAVFCLKKNSTK